MGCVAGNDMIGALGAEIDRLEYEIKQAVPGIRHIDLVKPGCLLALLEIWQLFIQQLKVDLQATKS